MPPRLKGTDTVHRGQPVPGSATCSADGADQQRRSPHWQVVSVLDKFLGAMLCPYSANPIGRDY